MATAVGEFLHWLEERTDLGKDALALCEEGTGNLCYDDEIGRFRYLWEVMNPGRPWGSIDGLTLLASFVQWFLADGKFICKVVGEGFEKFDVDYVDLIDDFLKDNQGDWGEWSKRFPPDVGLSEPSKSWLQKALEDRKQLPEYYTSLRYEVPT